ncbi:MAG: serine/threonine protein kinase, partial [Planctomycetota bacterium]
MKIIANKYKVLEPLGKGGFGAVYLAQHVDLDEELFAIKILHPEISSDEGLLKRFQREAKVLKRLLHPNSIPLRDFGTLEDGSYYMAMDYCKGKALSKILKEKGRLDYKEVLEMMIQVLDVLELAHKEGIIHRDLKPDNLMIVEEKGQNIVKVLDFGIAKIKEAVKGGQDTVSSQMTKEGTVMGTPYYMSPEQCSGSSKIDERSDIYSLGMVMYHLLSGKSPYFAESIDQLLRKQMTLYPEPFDKVVPEADIPLSVSKIVFKAIQKEPENRFQSASEMKEACQKVLEGFDPLNDNLAFSKVQEGDPSHKSSGARFFLGTFG